MDTNDVQPARGTPRRRRIGVRASLAILVIGCILPISAVAAFLIFDYYQREQQRLVADAISRVRAIGSAVERDFVSIEATLFALATSERLNQGDLLGFHTRAVDAVRLMKADSLMVIDPHGQLLLSTRVPFGSALPQVDVSGWRTLLRNDGRSFVSNIMRGPMLGKPMFAVGTNVTRLDGSIVMLNAAVEPLRMIDLLREQKFPDSWRAAIIDGAGTIVARSHDAERYVGFKASPSLMARLFVTPEDGFRGTTLEGIDTIIVYSRSLSTGWSIALGMPIDEVTGGLRKSIAWLIIAVLVALAIGLFSAWYIGGRIARSITALAEPARRLGSGRKGIVDVPRVHFKEASELADALVEASVALDIARHDAHHDPLTGLANRVLLNLVIDRQLALCRRQHRELSVMFLDLDGFKVINDTYGHAPGDQMLKDVAVRIVGSIRAADIAARLGGDEFAVCLLDTGIDGAEHVAQKLIEALSRPFVVSGAEASISASVGVAAFPASADDVDTLLKRADAAMYRAKSLGKNQVCVSGKAADQGLR